MNELALFIDEMVTKTSAMSIKDSITGLYWTPEGLAKEIKAQINTYFTTGDKDALSVFAKNIWNAYAVYQQEKNIYLLRR